MRVMTLIAAFSAISFAQDPRAVLKKVSATYKSLKNYDFEVTQRSESPGLTFAALEFRLAGVRPDKFYLEQKMPAADIVCVNDGDSVCTYLPKKKAYTRHSGSAVEGEEDLQGQQPDDDPLVAAQKLLINRYSALGALSGGAGFRTEDSIKVGGKKIDCYVIEIHLSGNGGSHQLWIDKSRFIVVRHMEVHRQTFGRVTAEVRTTLSWKKAEIEAEPDAKLFAFTPPGKAKEVEVLDIPGQAHVSLTGTHAADFKLKDLEGNEVTLAGLRGKVVLLDFWASWCGPCRRELPSIEKMFESYKGSDVVILSVNDEETGTARGFAKKNNLTFPVLMDGNRKVHAAYHVRSIPSVVIVGRDGVIAKHFIGTRDERELRAAVDAAAAR